MLRIGCARSGVLKNFEELIAKINIYKQQHYTMTMTGESCHRFVHHHEWLCEQTLLLFFENIAADNADLRTQATTFIAQMKDLMETTDLLCSIMTRFGKQTPETIEWFKRGSRYLGIKYRLYFKEVGPPKLHLMEVHLVQDLLRIGRTAIFGEDGMEREHKINAQYGRVYACIRSQERKTQAIYDRRGKYDNQEVAASIGEVDKGTKRTIGPVGASSKMTRKQKTEDSKTTRDTSQMSGIKYENI